MKYWKLPKEFTEKWLKALRSGEYEQGEGMLKDNIPSEIDTHETYCYCCLGVAGDLCSDVELYTGIEQMPGENDTIVNSVEYPKELKQATTCGALEKDFGKSITDILVKLNDGFTANEYLKCVEKFPELIFSKTPEFGSTSVKYSFEEIADFIESNCELV